MKKLIFVVSLLIGGCASQQIPLTKSNEDAAKLAILRNSRNPDAIQFGPMTAGRFANTTSVCAMVNGTNGLGGYTGWTPVYVLLPSDGSEPVIREGSNAELNCSFTSAGLKQAPVSEDLLKKHHIGEKQ